jgi:hypothetical protein
MFGYRTEMRDAGIVPMPICPAMAKPLLTREKKGITVPVFTVLKRTLNGGVKKTDRIHNPWLT